VRDSLHSVEDWIRYGDELRRPLLVGPNLAQSTKLYVIGAGLSGLTIAYRIATKRPDIEIEIIEKKNRCGGTIETWSDGQWSCDVAVNAARPHPAFWRLVDDLELGGAFSGSNPKASSRWILKNGKKSKLSLFSALRMGPFRLLKTIRASRNGGVSVAEVLPDKSIADAMTLGIVNDLSHHVDADFLMPSLTKFGQTPPLKWSHIKKKMMKTYPLFTPKKGSIASFEGGMQTLIDALVDKVSQLPNITFHFGEQFDTPQQVASERNVPIHSVVWCGPLTRTPDQFTQLDIYAVGYSEKDASNVPLGYGTLIPDKSVPISGILHESDVHKSSRAPSGHRLFRIMAPKDRGGELDSIAESLKDILCKSEPTFMKKIGERRIPSYPPGYMEALNLNSSEFTQAGWFSSGVSVTHVVAEAERIADLF
tara:strand:- start:19 stop:1287 length:1269 start_codon:yes stop_codon:yes gene_type:complete